MGDKINTNKGQILGKLLSIFIGCFLINGFGAEDSLKTTEEPKQVSRIQTVENGVNDTTYTVKVLGNDSASPPSDLYKANPKLIWDAGDKIQSSVWMSLAGSGCYVLANLAGYKNTPLLVIGIGGGITFSILSIVKMYGAGESLKSASGAQDERGKKMNQFDPNHIDGINCIDLPNAVDRYNCSRIKRGK